MESEAIDQMFSQAEAIEREQGVQLALEFLAQCADESRKRYGADSLPYAAVLNQQGFVNRSHGHYPEAVEFFSQACNVLTQAVGKGHPEYATALMNLAGVQRLLGQLPESLQLFEEALDIYREAYGEDSVMYLTALNNIALSYQDMGDTGRALRCHLQVCFQLEELSEETGELAVEYGTSLCNTGICFCAEGEELLGCELIERALAVYATVLPDEHFLVRHARQTLEAHRAEAAIAGPGCGAEAAAGAGTPSVAATPPNGGVAPADATAAH